MRKVNNPIVPHRSRRQVNSIGGGGKRGRDMGGLFGREPNL